MLKIDFLKNHPHHIPRLIELWNEGIGKTWLPKVCLTRVKDKLMDHLNDDCLPLTLIALENDQPIGMCSLRINDGIREDLTPWLGSLVVDPQHQKQGVGKLLIEAIQDKAHDLGFDELYLLTFDPTLPNYYQRLGWTTIGVDHFNEHPVTVMKFNQSNAPFHQDDIV